ncbi:MAG TPA: EAL domain-containing protein [Micromonosporaceae bacterium]|jgi:diguanylate cyclase (GGDEF)-like protein|nr:EAL domain-containing protein [Micromonosporaceae bacterium]
MAATRVYLLLTTVGAAVSFLVGSYFLLGPQVAIVVNDCAQLAAGLLAAGCCWWTARGRPRAGRTWRLLLGIGMAGRSAGQAIWSWYQIFGDRALPSPSWADFGYLVLPGFAFAALLAFPRDGAGTPSRRSTLVLVLDGLIVVGSLFILTWTTTLGAVVEADAPTWPAFVVAIAHPLADLVLVVIVVLLVASNWIARRHRPQLVLLGIGLVALSFSDSIVAYLVASGATSMPAIADAGFVVGPMFIAVAALECGRTTERAAEGPGLRENEWPHLLLPYLPLAATGVLILLQTVGGNGPGTVEIYLGLLVIFLVVARQLITLLENTALLDSVREGQQRLAYQAFHDSLTGLGNRALFRDRLIHAVELHHRDHRRVALLFVDLDDFKLVNDSLGHMAGDVVLRAVGERLTAAVRNTGTVARLGGDEFGALLDGVELPERVAQRVLDALRTPFDVGGQQITVGASLGVVIADAPEPDLTADALLRRVDAAMYDGKRNGKGGLVIYSSGLAAGLANPDLPTLLAAALRGESGAGAIEVQYQPIVRMDDGVTVAVEALARWTNPTLGCVPPDVFVAAAERSGLVASLDNLVLDRACRDVAMLPRQNGYGAIGVHVNVSASRLGCPFLEARVRDSLTRHRLPGNRLVLEITETSRIQDLDAAAASTQRLRELGVRLALDDFGTGYNTLAHLHALPVDIVKLDQALTAIDGDVQRTEALGRSVVSISRALGMSVIAEGVETFAQANTLASWGCSLGQGFLYGRSVPIEELRAVTAELPRRSLPAAPSRVGAS